MRMPVPISSPNSNGPQKGPWRKTVSGTSRAFCGMAKRTSPTSRAASATKAAATSPHPSAGGTSGRRSEPSTTMPAADRTPPATSPSPKAYCGAPRQTGEFSTTAELRLQVEPETEKPATVPIAR